MTSWPQFWYKKKCSHLLAPSKLRAYNGFGVAQKQRGQMTVMCKREKWLLSEAVIILQTNTAFISKTQAPTTVKRIHIETAFASHSIHYLYTNTHINLLPPKSLLSI